MAYSFGNQFCSFSPSGFLPCSSGWGVWGGSKRGQLGPLMPMCHLGMTRPITILKALASTLVYCFLNKCVFIKSLKAFHTDQF